MTPLLAFWSPFPIFILLPLGASAWTFLWRNDTTTSRVIDGQSDQNCTQVWHQEGEGFSWDPEGPWCIKLYSDPVCEHSNGISCEGYLWRQTASQNISGFSVYPMPPASVTAFGFASSTESPTATPTPTTTDEDEDASASADSRPTSEPASNDDGGLSAGATAGIVVGAVVALALLCAAFFYLGRRTARKVAAAAAAAKVSDAPPSESSTAQAPSNTDPSSAPSENLSSSPTLHTSTSAPMPGVAELPKSEVVEGQDIPPTHNQPPNGTRMIELPGPIPGGELSNSRQLQEMAVTGQIQELDGGGMKRDES